LFLLKKTKKRFFLKKKQKNEVGCFIEKNGFFSTLLNHEQKLLLFAKYVK